MITIDCRGNTEVSLCGCHYAILSTSICICRQVCRTWCRLAGDEFLWRDLVYRHWSIDRSVPRSAHCSTWRAEYERLYDRCPVIESEVLRSHTDQVLHVSFSHDGRLFATTSKDGFIKVNTQHINSSAYCENNCIDLLNGQSTKQQRCHLTALLKGNMFTVLI